MKALLYDKYGSAEVLEIRETEAPAPKKDEVLVRVHAVSVNDWDWGLVLGKGVNRVIAGLFRPKKIIGSDVAGRVVDAGGEVKRFRPGDAVFGDLCHSGFGGFAEYVCASESALARKPERMTFEQAAAIPQAGTLAYQGLFARGPLKPGQKVLINGAGGGVGTIAIQIAKLHGVEVTGVDSAEKLDMMRSIGFDHVIDYRTEDFTKSGKRYDLILDTKTNRSLFDYARALNPGGTYATLGGTSHLAQVGLLGPWIGRLIRKRVFLVMLKPNKGLPYLCELFEAGKLAPVIDGPYRFSQAREA
ncbi:MAG TPA: NAD(P)-dependent alcohol dehydrogenase, partial [Bryobacteraceae bacterium]|nr:NAD(P)-dependent alcohol dehydrogenase [Bryobacteraceae bacterium]